VNSLRDRFEHAIIKAVEESCHLGYARTRFENMIRNNHRGVEGWQGSVLDSPWVPGHCGAGGHGIVKWIKAGKPVCSQLRSAIKEPQELRPRKATLRWAICALLCGTSASSSHIAGWTAIMHHEVNIGPSKISIERKSTFGDRGGCIQKPDGRNILF